MTAFDNVGNGQTLQLFQRRVGELGGIYFESRQMNRHQFPKEELSELIPTIQRVMTLENGLARIYQKNHGGPLEKRIVGSILNRWQRPQPIFQLKSPHELRGYRRGRGERVYRKLSRVVQMVVYML